MLFLLLQECVPVILSDQVELPFQNVVDYTQISIKWPSTLIGPELLQYLESIPGQMQHSITSYTGLSFVSAYRSFLLSVFNVLLLRCTSPADKNIEGMISRGRQVRCLWAYASESASCSAMHGILWELQRKVRLFHQSTETFWLHNGSVVNRNLVEFSDWRPPMPLPWLWHGIICTTSFYSFSVVLKFISFFFIPKFIVVFCVLIVKSVYTFQFPSLYEKKM